MFGIGTWELVVILILALLLLGPDKLPGVARSIGQTLTKLRRTADEVKREIDLDGLKQEIRKEVLEDPEIDALQHDLDVRGDIRRAMAGLQDPPPLPAPPGAASPPGPPPDRAAEQPGPSGSGDAEPPRDPGEGLAG